jgi:hypothetical protein
LNLLTGRELLEINESPLEEYRGFDDGGIAGIYQGGTRAGPFLPGSRRHQSGAALQISEYEPKKEYESKK